MADDEYSAVLTIRGRAVRFDDGGLANLNDIWSAAGFTKNNRPNDWLRLHTTQRRIERVLKLITGKSRNYDKADMHRVLKTKIGAGGGTYADVRLALDYAEYLNPGLAIEVKEVFLRVNSNDPTLADEIMESADQEANEWMAKRSLARAARLGYTNTLKDHGVTRPSEYGACTNATYSGLFGKNAKSLKEERGVKKNGNLRDAMNLKELATLSFSEVLSSDRIEDEGRHGFKSCFDATHKVATSVRALIEADRKDRQPKLGF